MFLGEKGRNGKTTLEGVILNIIGGYGATVRPEIILRTQGTRSSSGPTPEIMDLKGKRLVFASETNQGEMFDASVVKRLTGGDTLVGRLPYSRYEARFSPTHTLILQTNFAPNANAEDLAFWRRTILVRFNMSFVDNPDPNDPSQAKINKDIEQQLLEEGESILKWLIDGALLYAEEGLAQPWFIKKSVEEYRTEVDHVGHFLDTCCVQDENNKIQSSEFARVFGLWCIENGYKKMSLRNVASKMKGRGYRTIIRSSMYYVGIRWSPECDEILDRARQKNADYYL